MNLLKDIGLFVKSPEGLKNSNSYHGTRSIKTLFPQPSSQTLQLTLPTSPGWTLNTATLCALTRMESVQSWLLLVTSFKINGGSYSQTLVARKAGK